MKAVIALKDGTQIGIQNLKYIQYLRDNKPIKLEDFSEFALLGPLNEKLTFVGDSILAVNSDTINFVHFSEK